MEEWRKVPGTFYEVTAQGEIRNFRHPRHRLSYRCGDGRRQVHVGSRSCDLARLVYSVFVRPLDDSEVVHHIDGDPRNDKLSNLECLPSQGTHRRIHAPRLNPEAAKVIRFFKGKVPQAKLASLYRISQTTVSAVQRGVLWNIAKESKYDLSVPTTAIANSESAGYGA